MLNNKNILITGSNGMLGVAFQKQLKKVAIPLNRKDCDVTNIHEVMRLEKHDPHLIIHCAANVNADLCEKHPEQCRDTQVRGTENIIKLAQKTGATIFYPQSFLIFDGKEKPITESTTPNPLSVYGKCKLEASQLIQENTDNHLIVQMGGFFGGFNIDKNFVGKFVPHIIELIKQKVTSVKVGNRIWQPTYTDDIAKNSIILLDQNKRGIYNMASHGHASFYDVAVTCIEILGLSNLIEIVQVDASVVENEENAQRPASAIMQNKKLKIEKFDYQRKWQTSLSDYLTQPYFLNLVKNL